MGIRTSLSSSGSDYRAMLGSDMLSSPLHALSHYRLLPSLIPMSSLVIAAAARVPYAMIPLGAVVGITGATGSIALGGLTTSIVALSSAISSPLLGRLSDRIGTPTLLKILWPISAFSTACLLAATFFAWSDWRLFLAATATGATMIPVGALTRARWVQLRPAPQTLSTAFSYETMVDELMFVVGPIAVGLTSVAATWAPIACASILIFFAVGFFTWDSAHTPNTTNSSAPTLTQRSAHHSSGRPQPAIMSVLWAVAPAIGAMIAMGLIFGTTQTGLTERAIALGRPSEGGLWYGLMGIGSATISILAVMIPPRITAPMRIGTGALLLAAMLHLASNIDSLPATGILLFFSGFGMGTVLVTSFAVSERLCPPGGVAVAMTAMPAAVTIGVSAGSVIGGYAATWGSHVAFHAGTAAAFVALMCALWLQISIKRSSIK